MLELAKEFLEGENKDLNVTICSNAKEAVPLLLKRRFDVVISDYLMPYMSGVELLKEMRSNSIDIPFILFTGKGREEVAIDALNNGADFYLNKGGNPRVQFTELMNLVRHMVQNTQAMEAVKHNAERFRAMIENSLDVIGIINPDNTVRYISPSVRKLLGYEPEDVIGHPIEEMVHPDEKECMTVDISIGRKELSDLHEFRFRTKEGDYAFFEGSFSRMREDVGKGFVVFNGREITKRKRIEEMLKESEERYRVMFDTSPVGLLFIKGTVKDCNQTGLALLGYDKTDLVGKSFIDLWSEEQEKGQKAIEAIKGLAEMETGAVKSFTWVAKDRYGNKLTFDANLKNVDYRDERHYLLSFVPSEKPKSPAAKPSMTEETSRTLLTTTPDSVLVLDKKLNVAFASPMAGRTFGPVKDLIGRNMVELVEGADKDALVKDLGSLMKGGRPRGNRYRFKKRDSATIYSELSSNRIMNDHDETDGLICIFRDVTHMVMAEEQAISANRSLSEVTEVMRMEVEKRMTVLMAHLQILQFRYKDESDRAEVELAISNAEDVLKALETARSYELVESEPHQWVSLANVVDAALDGTEGAMKVSVDIENYLVFCSGKLGNALGRLFAECSRPDRGSTLMVVRTKEDLGRLVIVIEDDGTPFSDTDLDRLFESDASDPYTSTLRFSRDVLRSSGMDILAEKQAKGLSFKVQVPAGRYRK